MNHNHVETLIIYLDNKCNFNCTYCDRDYVAKVNKQSLNIDDDLRRFITNFDKRDITISFHGGEPLLFAKKIDSIVEWLLPIAKERNWKIGMTSNGSLVKKNEWLFIKYPKVFSLTISYDFLHQAENRKSFDVIEMSRVLNEYAKYWIWQTVLPIDKKDSLSLSTIQNIVKTCYETKCLLINFLVLRHIRGKDNFEVIIDRIDLNQFFVAFTEFLQILYIKKLKVYLDGNYEHIDKNYFGNHHYKMILSPDGYIYPEFEFLEYKKEYARIGKWRGDVEYYSMDESLVVLTSCMSCEEKSLCGLRYLHKMFDTTPSGNCKKFYMIIEFLTRHLNVLNSKKNIIDHIGINKDFEIK